MPWHDEILRNQRESGVYDVKKRFVHKMCNECHDECAWLLTHTTYKEDALLFETSEYGFIAYYVDSFSFPINQNKNMWYDCASEVRRKKHMAMYGVHVYVYFAYVKPEKRKMGILREMLHNLTENLYDSNDLILSGIVCKNCINGSEYCWSKLGFEVYNDCVIEKCIDMYKEIF